MSESGPIIVLVETQMGENIGMCARAMLNCGLTRLRLVRPRDGWPNEKARALCADADVVIDGAEVFETVEEAVADCHRVYATTARQRELNITSLPVDEVVAEIRGMNEGESSGRQAAVLFGPEASGLDNHAIAQADRVVHFPMNPEFSSLNLAQAVLLLAWEWWSEELKGGEVSLPDVDSAPKGEVRFFLDRLETLLEESGFFLTEEMKPRTAANVRALLTRANPTMQELKLFHGVLTALTRDFTRPGQ